MRKLFITRADLAATAGCVPEERPRYPVGTPCGCPDSCATAAVARRGIHPEAKGARGFSV